MALAISEHRTVVPPAPQLMALLWCCVLRPPWLRGLLTCVGLVILITARDCDAISSESHHSNCPFDVTDPYRNLAIVNCNQQAKKINITKMYFPEQVEEITISNVQEMEIQADAIASLTSLVTIKLTNIDTLTLLPRSLARNNDTGLITVTIQNVTLIQLHSKTFGVWQHNRSKITIEDVGECHIPEKTIPPWTFIRSLQLVKITNLTIEHNAFPPYSGVKNMMLRGVTSLTAEPGAFAPNTTIKSMELKNIESLTLKTGAFARQSSIENDVVERAASLAIDSGGIQADISKLIIGNVTMTTCEDNTFGSKIRNMLLNSTHIKLAKSGCISASTGWKNLHIKHSKFDHIEPSAISGTIEEVQIKDSNIGTVRTEGFKLNVTRFSVERSTMGDLSENAFDVYAVEYITLSNLRIGILRKHAFTLLQSKSDVEEEIMIKNLHIQQAENESMHFDPGTNVVVSNLDLGIPCTCDMELQLGLPFPMHTDPTDDTNESSGLGQTRCANTTTTPTLAEYRLEYCAEPTTTPPPTTKSTSTTTARTRLGGMVLQGRYNPPPPDTVSSNGSPVSGPTRTSGVNMWVVITTVTVALLMLITVVALLIRRRLRPVVALPIRRRLRQRARGDDWHPLTPMAIRGQSDSRTTERQPSHPVTAERNETESAASPSRRYRDTSLQQFTASPQTGLSSDHPLISPPLISSLVVAGSDPSEGSLGISLDRNPGSRRPQWSREGPFGRSLDRNPASRHQLRRPSQPQTAEGQQHRSNTTLTGSKLTDQRPLCQGLEWDGGM